MELDLSTVNKINAALRKGQITEKQLINEYKKMRKTVMRQLQRIQKSDIPFGKGTAPRPPTLKEISGNFGVDIRSLVREYAELEKFRGSKNYSLKGRKEIRKKTLATLRNHGINISDSEYLKWVQFITWFKNSAYAALYDSDSEVVLDVFEEGSNSRQWSKLFREYGE